MAKIEPLAGESPGKLPRPNLSDMRFARHLHQRYGPRGEDRDHYDEAEQMWDVPNCSQFSRAPQHCDHDCVEKEKVHRALAQPTESEKNPGRYPSKPRRLFLLPPAKPANESNREEGNVKRFYLNQASLLDHAEARQPDQRG